MIRLDATGAIDAGFQQNLSGAAVQARKVYPLANGQLLVLGNYLAGATQRNNLFRLNANGTLDPTFTLAPLGPYPGVAQALAQPDGRVLLLGSFNSSNAELYRLLPDGSRDPSFTTTLQTFSQNPQMLLQPDGKIILCGDLSQVNGNQAFFFARLNADGSTDASYHPAAYTNNRLYLNTIALDANGALLVGGEAINVVGGRKQAVFRLLPTGALDPTFALDASLLPRSCSRLAVQPGGQIVALFDTYASSANGTITNYPFRDQLVRLLPSGALDPTFQPGSGPDFTLATIRSQANGTLLTWGSFHNFDGQRRTLALLQPSGALDASFAPLLQEPGRVQNILRQADGKLVLTGAFNTVDGHLTDCVARLLPTGQPDVSFSWRQPASATLDLSAAAIQADGQLLLAGSTASSNIGGSNVPFFSRLTTTGTPDASFVPAITLGGIRLLAEQASGQILVGGSLTDVAGKTNLTRLTATGSVDPSFSPPANQPVVYSGLVQANGAIVCAVSASNSTNYPYSQTIERLLANGAPDPTFAYSPLAPATNIHLEGVFQVPAAGGYVTSGVFSSNQVLGRLTATGTSVAGFATPFQSIPGPADPESGVATVAAQSNGRLLVGGHMRQSSISSFSSPVTALARLEANGQLDPSFSTTFIANTSAAYGYNEVNSVVVQPDGTTLVGGYFSAAGGQPATGLVRLLVPTPLATTPAKRSSASLEAWPVPAHDVLHLSLTAAARPQQVLLLNTLGEIVLNQPASRLDLTLNTAALPPGMYLLRVEYADGVATRTVVLE
ncbi:T9SS type A sorting domain-containing protein [Hymenobacter psoromatis]|uniref:T9SS type A sorting domain-containing protein n=1 Tax=Hymenobacter psoromatis TaxID=1484116 RepID=UPI001CBF64E9|nr:T9SS type A sorting domain-containing protein [Hymenobacter psoromatis]